jgi:hypothetical protein
MEQQIKRLNGKIIYLHDLLQQHFKKEKIMYAEFNVSPDDEKLVIHSYQFGLDNKHCAIFEIDELMDYCERKSRKNLFRLFNNAKEFENEKDILKAESAKYIY